ncbi:Hypothetical protein CAP_2297 [Chondromyces apiculatus DSM 436]|uniref:Uncharacterized protein n=1 Tax=Chondromyces apiculatus DSM 436 TaxID=1192034 RepID=A0A017TB38_9BACT|nr:Hypothetical protein CAP_2297 [Chondromyces apiculatus DSM 436]
MREGRALRSATADQAICQVIRCRAIECPTLCWSITYRLLKTVHNPKSRRA